MGNRTVIGTGELDEKLKLYGLVAGSGTDENGFPIPDQIMLREELWCKVKTISTKEFIAADRAVTRLTYKFIIPRVETSSKDFIVYDGTTFNIKHIHRMDKFYLEITGQEVEEEIEI